MALDSILAAIEPVRAAIRSVPMLHKLLWNVISLTIWLAMLAVIFVPLERWFALRPGERTRRHTARDIGLYFLNSTVPAIALAFPAAALIALTYELLPEDYTDFVASLPIWVQLIATFIVGEIGFYWGHRWSHQLPILWQFHAQHHKPAYLDWLINTHAHPVDIIFGRLCGLIPIYLLGLAGHNAAEGNLPAILFTIAGVAWGFFIHANVRWPLRWIEPVISTPRFHHWHHTKSGQIDRNYASMLPLMDRLFGTLHMPGRQWPDDYGVKPRGS